MKWNNLRRSSNVEDLRSQSPLRGVGRSKGGLGLLLRIVPFLLKSKIGRIILVIGVFAYFLGYNPLTLLDNSIPSSKLASSPKNDDKSAEFVSVVLGQTEQVWHKIFSEHGLTYVEPKLVLFRQGTRSGCGFASVQTGPFYCPVDQKVYLDLSFFDELKNRFHSPGDFAEAYVIAHEIGHHVQNLLGTLKKSHYLKSHSSKKVANSVQVKVELQADCYAGIWAHNLKNILDDGDISEALNAANAIGDDTLQKQARGYVTPDSFTHGTSQQRMAWFKRGYQSGKLSACQTGI